MDNGGSLSKIYQIADSIIIIKSMADSNNGAVYMIIDETCLRTMWHVFVTGLVQLMLIDSLYFWPKIDTAYKHSSRGVQSLPADTSSPLTLHVHLNDTQ